MVLVNGSPEWLAVAERADAAFDAALGDDYGNFMESRMVVEEMAFGGDDRAVDALMAMDARLAAAQDAKAAVWAEVDKCGRSTFGLPCSKDSGHSGPCAPVDTRTGKNW